ncbi:conserved hypothetical protein, partial [Ricinus communis]
MEEDDDRRPQMPVAHRLPEQPACKFDLAAINLRGVTRIFCLHLFAHHAVGAQHLGH